MFITYWTKPCHAGLLLETWRRKLIEVAVLHELVSARLRKSVKFFLNSSKSLNQAAIISTFLFVSWQNKIPWIICHNNYNLQMSTNLLLNVWALPNKFKTVDCVVQILVLRFFTAVKNANVIRLIKTRKEMSLLQCNQ